MLEDRELWPCGRCEDGHLRVGGYVWLPVRPQPPSLKGHPSEEAGGVTYHVHECSMCGATEFTGGGVRARRRSCFLVSSSFVDFGGGLLTVAQTPGPAQHTINPRPAPFGRAATIGFTAERLEVDRGLVAALPTIRRLPGPATH